MYGNIAKAHSKDKKTRYYYYCKNTVTPTGHECSFRLNIEQMEINKFVAKVISAMVNNPRFVEAIQTKIGTAVDTEDMEADCCPARAAKASLWNEKPLGASDGYLGYQ